MNTDTCRTCIEYLTKDLGHRGSTTDNESKAAEYARRVLGALRVPQVEMQRFRSGVKIWQPYIVCLYLGLLSAILYPLSGATTRLLAALVSVCALWWLYRELNFENNLVRRILPKGDSQNVIGVIPPQAEVRRKVVLIGHLDSGQTPLLLGSLWTLPVFVGLSMAVVASLGLNAVLYAVGALCGDTWLYQVSWIGTALQGVTLIFALEAEISPYTQGANDNASAVGVVLSLAERAVEAPLQHTQVWTLLSGCEEVGCYGMIHFLDGYRDKLREAYFINMEGVGCGTLHYASSEGMLKAYPSDPELQAIAQHVLDQHPEMKGRAHVLRAGYTETGVVVKNGLKGITVLGLEAGGLYKYLPHWHQRGDTFDKLDHEALSRTHEFVWEMLQEIDRQATAHPPQAE